MMDQEKDLRLLYNFRTAGDLVSKEELVKKYLPMVRHIVKNYHIPLADFEDYLQEGSIGLLKAIDEYDPDTYAVKFSTFAYICILRRIFNALKSACAKKTIASAQILSLNMFINNEDESCTLLDLFPDLSFEPLTIIENNWMQQKLEMVLKAYLSPVEFKVVQMLLYGFNIKDIQDRLALSLKVIDNARTRARMKLAKILFHYGSLVNPKIPLKTRKRSDLTINVAAGHAAV